MAHRNLSTGEWQAYLDRFGDLHRSWLTSIEATVPGRPTQTLASNRRLGGLSVCPILDHGSAIEVWFQDAVSPPWVLLRNTIAVNVDDDWDGAVEIRDVDGRTIRIRVRNNQ